MNPSQSPLQHPHLSAPCLLTLTCYIRYFVWTLKQCQFQAACWSADVHREEKKKKAVIVTRAWVNIVELLLLQDGILMFSAQFAYWLVGWPWRKCTRTGIDFIQLVTNSSQPCTGKKRASVSKRYTPHTTSPVLFSYFYCSLGFTLSFLWRKQCHLLWMRGAEFVRTQWYKREVSICQRFNPTLMGKSKSSSSKCYWFML